MVHAVGHVGIFLFLLYCFVVGTGADRADYLNHLLPFSHAVGIA